MYGLSHRMTTEICLVNPPLVDVFRPSISLGILKAILERAGFSVATCYANMWYAEHVGAVAYKFLSRANPEDALGDWLFGKAAFPDFEPDHDQFFNELFRARPDFVASDEGERRTWLLAQRAVATDFIEAVVDRLLAQKPRIVGCTSTFNQHGAALAILQRVRARDPSIVTLLGGANCEGKMGRATHRNFPWVDYVVSGEAEDLVVPLCKGALTHGREIPLAELPYGVLAPVHRETQYPSVKAGDGVPRATAMNLDAAPTPDYTEFFAEVERSPYRAGLIPSVLIETSRGCWWGQVSHCTFCGLNGHSMAFRSKRPARVLEEIDELVAKHDVRRFEAVDNILDMRYFGDLLPQLAASDRKLSIFYETKSNLSAAQIELLARSGVRTIQPGIESLDTRVLKLMKKGVASWQNIRLLRWARQYGVRVQWSTIYGFPGEQDEWYAQMCSFMPYLRHLQPGGIHRLRFDRFSPYHSDPAAWGLRLEPYPLYRYAFPLDADELQEQAYFFIDPALVGDEYELRPGLRRYIELCVEWRDAWTKAPKPTCVLFDAGGRHMVRDTRFRFDRNSDRELSDVADSLLREAQEGIPAQDLVPRVASITHAAPDAIEAELRELIETGLILSLDKRLLTIALRVPVVNLSRWFEIPLGTMVWGPAQEKAQAAAGAAALLGAE